MYSDERLDSHLYKIVIDHLYSSKSGGYSYLIYQFSWKWAIALVSNTTTTLSLYYSCKILKLINLVDPITIYSTKY